MKSLKDDVYCLLKNKIYVLALLFTVLCCYGFKISQVTIGIDDTPYHYYFSEGLIVVVGRWVLFILNQILGIGDFAPFLTDFCAVLLFLLAVTLWAVLFRRIFGQAIPDWCYALFACMFISNPLIGEVFTYFLHNGVCIGYLFTALALLMMREGLAARGIGSIRFYSISIVGVWIAIGCYESFAVVFLVGFLLMLWSERICGGRNGMIRPAMIGCGILIAAIIMRSAMTVILIHVFELGYLKEEAVQRSLSEAAGWLFSSQGMADMIMSLKRLFVTYGVFGIAYLPIAVYMAASIFITVYGIGKAIREKDIWIGLFVPVIFIASWILILIEGKVTLYRACQFLPMFCAFAMLLFFYSVRRYFAGKLPACIIAVSAAVLIFNQSVDLNKWFYVDYLKYEAAKETMCALALELEKEFDMSKTLVVTGIYEIPYSIIKEAYVPIGSEKYWKMKRLTDIVDEHLLEKYFRGNSVQVAQTPSLSVIQWGMSAFESNQELINFLGTHGYEFIAETNPEKLVKATEESKDMPRWPANGSIVEKEDYVLVHF